MVFDLWPVYSGEGFRALGPSCLLISVVFTLNTRLFYFFYVFYMSSCIKKGKQEQTLIEILFEFSALGSL